MLPAQLLASHIAAVELLHWCALPTKPQAPMLSALELGRQARIAANRAYLSALGLGAGAVHSNQARRWGQARRAVRGRRPPLPACAAGQQQGQID